MAAHGKRFRFGQPNRGHESVLLKVLNREHSGVFAGGLTRKSRELPFREVPEHLHFCLKEIVPYCYLQGHVFMGLTACGQFLISYKASCDYDEVITSEYNFSSNYKYELYFWIYRPHFLLSKYFQVCLFDDHGVDDIKTVSMTQWKTDQRLLLVHGASEKDDCDSYVTVVRVPTLGCLDCRKLRDETAEEDGGENRVDILCIKCNMTIHTKYRNSDSGPRFNPRYNLNCPGFIIMSENSFIHTVNIRLDMSRCPARRPAASSAVLSSKYISQYPPREPTPTKEPQPKVPILAATAPPRPPTPAAAPPPPPQSSLSIADQIIADFAEYETETCESRGATRLSSTSSSSTTTTTTTYPENFDELVITCTQQPLRPSMASPPPNVRLMNHRTNTNIELRITSPEGSGGGGQTPKSYVTRVDLQATASSSSSSGSSGRTPLRRRSYLAASSRSPTESNNVPSTSNAAAAKAYEFSEDTEPGEKISTFRKRRLADKKYEFSEDSSHGDSVIVPFNRLRARGQNPAGFEMTTHLHRASPSHGFRSPCGSPVGNRYLRSPPGIRSPNYYRHHSPVATPSSNPRPQTAAQLIKMSNFDPKDYIYSGSLTTTTTSTNSDQDIPKFFIDAIHKFNEKKLQAAAAEGNNENFNSDNLLPSSLKPDPVQVKPEKPICSKKIVKIFVEEDDANSVVTTEEDDCISPGYHTSLPMEVHGSCYSTMQIISPASFQKLHCPAVVVTQNSFDMETFSFHVANHICAKSDKKYGILFDSAYELTHVCPLTETVTCTMVLQFTASDTNKASKCHNCLTTIDCPTHRKIYQCRSLFTWNMATGVWTVLDYGHLGNGPYLELKKLASNYNRLLGELRYFTRKLFGKDSTAQDMARTYEYLGHLRVLDCNNEKTKQRLVDLVHMIEFYRKQRAGGGESDDSEEEDSEDDDSISTVGSDRDDANTVVGEAGLTSDTVSDEDDN
ncbi:uncharacterized protein LOC120425387 [Culex pipiens pallens]|uniref:uncharacterized protein LOC120425387 n=1 Tax=Culex pipiens pallens TaxID=42434 RepID=UPI001953A741|nr:uncharacterized protein LOC120425387 [Culex pipiens pallens]